jgi:lipoprotein
MKKYLLLFFASLGLLMSSCSDNDEPTPGPIGPVDGDTFTFEEVDITSRTATVRVTPVDMTQPYVALITLRDVVDEFPTEEEFFQQVFDEFEGMGWTLESQLMVGPKKVDAYRLQPNELYTVAVFGCTKDGTPTTKLYTHDFMSLAKAREQVDVTFDIKVTDLMPDSATITVTPSNNDAVYVTFAGDRAIVDQYPGNLLLVAQYMVVYAESDGQIDWGNYDSSQNIRKGKATFNYNGMLAGDSDQAVICFAINKWGEVISEVGLGEFHTPAPPRSDMTFTFDVQNLTFNSADVTITPSKTNETYYANVAVKSFMDEMTDEEFMEGYMNQYTLDSTPSVEINEHGTLEPNTEYVAFGFGCSASCATTDLMKYVFKTPDFVYKSGGDAWVDQQVLLIEDGAYVQMSGFGIISMQYIPNEKTKHYYVAMAPEDEEEAWFQMSEDELKQAIILSPWSTSHEDNLTIWADKLGRTATLYTVGEDEDGNFGDINTKKLKVQLSTGAGINTFSSVAKWNREANTGGHLVTSQGPVSAFTPKAPAMK